jgi:D-serine deaminase-like pyridoxal phosphate-dependent protein
MDVSVLPSPVLVVDMGAFEANVAAADRWCRGTSTTIRPHVKAHRTPALALRQLTAGTSGLTCATVGEAEAMIDAGASDVLVANEVVDRRKLDRLADLARRAAVCVAIDAPEAAEALGAAARAAGSTVAVLVDMDVGLGRCGVPGPAEAVKLGAAAAQTPGLRLAGLMGYEGRQRAGGAGRAAVIEHAYAMLAEAKQAFDRAGLPAGTVSSAGTSTMREALADPAVTEIQAGTYALMEANLDGLGLPFVPALSVVATVISRTDDRAVLDVGRKSIAGDYGPPAPLIPGAEVAGFNEEHTTLRFPDPSAAPPPALGDRVALRPEHVRLTFNLHDAVWLAHPDGSFERAQVTARGRSW